MFNIFVIAVLAAIVGVGLVELIKNFLPANTSAKVKTVISLIIVAVVAVLIGIFDLLIGAAVSCPTLVVIVEAVLAIGLSQVFYNYICQVLSYIKEKLKSLIKKE